MVITGAKSASNSQTSNTNMDDYSDNESDISLPGFGSQNVIGHQQMAECERDHERVLSSKS